jgi:hypothetical protein
VTIHGSASSYRSGLCREECCREPHRIATAQNRAERLKAGRINHGTRSGYDAGCRCPACRGARSAAHVRASQRAAAARNATAQPGQDATVGPRVVSGYPRGGRGRLSRFRGKPVRDVQLPETGGAA